MIVLSENGDLSLFDSVEALEIQIEWIDVENNEYEAFTGSGNVVRLSVVRQFSEEYEGTIVTEPRGTGNSIENVAEFEGFTLGERREQGGFSHKPEDYVWNDFIEWIKQK